MPRWGTTNERILSPKKIYACDLGVKHLFIGNRDLGSYFENYIYLLIQKHQPVFYYKDQDVEIDFITQDGTLVEATYSMGRCSRRPPCPRVDRNRSGSFGRFVAGIEAVPA